MNTLSRYIGLSLTTLMLSFTTVIASPQAKVTSAAATITPIADHLNPSAQTTIIVPAAPTIDARGYVLMDANSGTIIAEKNMHKKMPPASLTKLMTLYVVSQAIANKQVSLDDTVRISKEAWSRGGSRMFLKLGSHVPLADLIHGIIVASGNDACVATAQYLAGNESSFAALMNQNAARLGMKDTHYVDSTGLPKPGHYSTPYDMALLTRAIINDFPQDYSWYKQKWIKYNNIRQPNRNRLLWRDPSVDGLKTGHTQSAGYCLISSAQRNGMRLLSVVMGTPSDSSRTNDSEDLLNWGFRFYETHKLFSGYTPLASPRVWLGKNEHAQLGLTHDLYVTVPRGSYASLKAKMSINPSLKAPIAAHQVCGNISVTLHNKTIAEIPLLALQADPAGGLWTRMTDHISLFFHHLF